MVQVAEQQTQVFESGLTELVELLSRTNPMKVLAHFAYYDLTILSHRPACGPSYQPLTLAHFEILQALCLSVPPGEMKSGPTAPPALVRINQLLNDICRAFHLRRLASGHHSGAMPPAEQMRTHTQAVRSCLSPDQTLASLRRLFAPLDSQLERSMGIRPTLLPDMFLKLAKHRAAALETRIRSFRRVIRRKSIADVVAAYQDLTGDSSAKEMLALSSERGWSLDQVRVALQHDYDQDIAKYYIFTTEEFAGFYGAPVKTEAMEGLLNLWALTPFELSERHRVHFFLENPVWTRPLIRLRPGEYFWPMIQGFLPFGLQIMERLLDSTPALQGKYQQSIRPKFLEDEAERIIRAHFPKALILRGSCWTDPRTGQQFENDLLAVLDCVLIAIECKSARIPSSARRGGERLEHALRTLMVEPAVQSARLVDHLTKPRGAHEFRARSGQAQRIDTSGVRHVIRLSLTLESLGPLACQSGLLLKAGLVKEGFSPAVTLAVAELETVLEMLEGTHQKLHYLVRRAELEAHAEYFADESDLLAFYLSTGFNVGRLEFQTQPLMLHGASELLVPYFNSRSGYGAAEKPRLRLTQWFRDLLAKIELRAFPGWTDAGFFLLAFDYETQRKFEAQVKRLIRSVKSNWHISGHQNTLYCYVGPDERKTAVAVYVYKNITKQERDARVRAVFAELEAESGCKDALVLGFMADQPKYPYDLVSIGLGIGEPAHTQPPMARSCDLR